MTSRSDSDSNTVEYEDGEYEYPIQDMPEEYVEVSEGPNARDALEGDAAVGAAITRAGSTAAGAAKDAGRSIAGGFSAMRQVRQASKMRANARAEVREIEEGLEENRALLAHREDVAQHYDEIVAAQTSAINAAQDEIDLATDDLEKQAAKRKRLTDELRRMKERHEQELRPYRNLMDSSRGRSDDAAKALANARRSVKSAEALVNEKTKNRAKRIQDAHRAVDNAKERVRAVEEERNALQADGATDEAAIAKVESELATEQRSLQMATSDVERVTQEAQAAVDQAQKDLWSKQREQSVAEKAAEKAKEEATTHKNEYDGRFKEAQSEERAHEDAIKSCEARMKDLNKTKAAAEARKSEAQAVLDEATEIHAHPETTEGLRQRIANEERDLADARADLDELTATERELRRATRGARTTFMVVAIVIAAIVIVVLWFLFLRQG